MWGVAFFPDTGGCFGVLVLGRFRFEELKKDYKKLVMEGQREKRNYIYTLNIMF